MIQVSFSWLIHHSKMKKKFGPVSVIFDFLLFVDDAIILGASKLSHLTANITACLNSRPLPKQLQKVIGVRLYSLSSRTYFAVSLSRKRGNFVVANRRPTFTSNKKIGNQSGMYISQYFKFSIGSVLDNQL